MPTVFPDLNSSKKNWTEAKLVNDLLTDYNSWARPRVNPREIVNVWLFMYLFLLNDVVSFHQTLKKIVFSKLCFLFKMTLGNYPFAHEGLHHTDNFLSDALSSGLLTLN